MEKQRPISIEELQKMYKPPRNAAMEARETLTWHERFALHITKRVGSIGFFVIVALWTLVWISWNTLALPEFRFDPFPSFVVWLFVSNVIQLLLLPLILIGQNLQNRSFEADAEADYELNKKSNHEIETILRHLEYHEELLEKVMSKHS